MTAIDLVGGYLLTTRFCPALRVVKLHSGSKKERERMKVNEKCTLYLRCRVRSLI